MPSPGHKQPSVQAYVRDDAAEQQTQVMQEEDPGYEVWIHIYDLGPWSKWVLNSWVRSGDVATAGAFHVGVEVCGVELAYQALQGDHVNTEKTGVWAHEPKMNPAHVYRESVFLGKSPMVFSEIQELVNVMSRDWLARSYHYVNKNCVDFAEEFARNLQVPRPFPRWAHGLAKGVLMHTPLSSVKSEKIPSFCGSVASNCGSCGSAPSNCSNCDSTPRIKLLRTKQEAPLKQTL